MTWRITIPRPPAWFERWFEVDPAPAPAVPARQAPADSRPTREAAARRQYLNTLVELPAQDWARVTDRIYYCLLTRAVGPKSVGVWYGEALDVARQERDRAAFAAAQGDPRRV